MFAHEFDDLGQHALRIVVNDNPGRTWVTAGCKERSCALTPGTDGFGVVVCLGQQERHPWVYGWVAGRDEDGVELDRAGGEESARCTWTGSPVSSSACRLEQR